MTKDIQTLSLRSLLLAGAAAVAASSWTVPALAQDEDDDDEDTFIITGSLIPRSDVTSENPVTIVSGDDLRATGLSNLGESLRETLAAGSGGFNQSSVLSGGGATSIDLRNMGANRVLILINGRRVASFADSLANLAGDLSLVPLAAVQRVEILRDGASSVYGADAVTGVVNVILRDNFEGFTVEASTGISDRGDGEQMTVSAVMGGNFERGNIIASLEYRRNDNVRQRDREFAFPTISSLSSTRYNNGSFFSPGGVFFGWNGTVCTVPQYFGGDESTLYSGGGVVNCPSFQSAPAGNGRRSPTRYDYAIEQDMFNGSQIFGATFFGTYDLTDNITAFMEFQANHRESDSRLDGNPGYFAVASSNPYTGSDGIGGGLGLGWGSMFVRPTSTVGPRQRWIDAGTLRTVVGLQGEDLLGRFNWEVSYLWTKLNSEILVNSVFNPWRMSVISSPALCWQGATVLSTLCQAALAGAGKFQGPTSGGYVGDALNPAAPGTWSQSEINFFRQRSMATSVFETEGWRASISGDIVELPAGPLSFAAGYEWREEQGFNKPDSVTEAGESIANQVFTTSGSFDVNELFGELRIPVLSGVQWAEQLDLSLQGRWFDYSNFGDDTVWKVGVDYQITPDVRFRFSQGTAFRAPTITNLYGGGTASFDFLSFLCSSTNSTPTAVQIANCNNDGIAGPPFPAQFAGQFNVLSGSNPNLQPETADTLSFGFVFTPEFLPNFSATIDWWEIELENLITRPTSDSVIDSCYNFAGGIDALGNRSGPCALFTGTHPTTGLPLGLVNQLVNSTGSTRTDGIDWAFTYFWDQLGGTFTLSHEGTYVFENTFSPGQGGANGNSGSIPQFKALAGLSYERNNWSVRWRTQVIGDMDDTVFQGTDNVFNYDGPEAHIVHSISGRYSWNNYTFLAGVNNLFDEMPPYVFNTGNNSDLFTYNAMGRYYFARVTADF